MISENEMLQSHSKDPGLVHSWLTFIRPTDEWSELTSLTRFGPFNVFLFLRLSKGIQHVLLQRGQTETLENH